MPERSRCGNHRKTSRRNGALPHHQRYDKRNERGDDRGQPSDDPWASAVAHRLEFDNTRYRGEDSAERLDHSIRHRHVSVGVLLWQCGGGVHTYIIGGGTISANIFHQN